MPTWDDDDALMADLGRAIRAREEVPDRARQAARMAFAWRTVDEELMALTHDSALGSATLVRGVQAGPRVVAFQLGELGLEVELDGAGAIGQVLPGSACVVTVESPQGSAAHLDVDESGFFTLAQLPEAALRIRVELPDGRVATTPWFHT